MRDLKVEQESLLGQRKGVSQRLSRGVQGGREAARKLRRFIQARLDSDDERLTQFGIAPIRSRRRKAIEKPPPEGDTPPAPEVTKPVK